MTTYNFDTSAINLPKICDMVIEILSGSKSINNIMLKYGIPDVSTSNVRRADNGTADWLITNICQHAAPEYIRQNFPDVSQNKAIEVIGFLRRDKRVLIPAITRYKNSLTTNHAVITILGTIHVDRIIPSEALVQYYQRNQPTKESIMGVRTPEEKSSKAVEATKSNEMDICTLIKLRAVCSTLKAISGFVDNSFVTHEAEYSRFAAVNDINWASRPFLPGQVTPGYIPMQQVAAAASFIQRPEGNNPFVGLVFSEAELDQVQTKLNEIANILFKGK